MRDWKSEMTEAANVPHKFHRIAQTYMRETSRKDFDSSLFSEMLAGVQSFEQALKLLEFAYGEDSRVKKPRSAFTRPLWTRALELADDAWALEAIIAFEWCPARVRKRAEVRLLLVREEERRRISEQYSI